MAFLTPCVCVCVWLLRELRENPKQLIKNADSSLCLDPGLSAPSPSLTTCRLLNAQDPSLLVSSTPNFLFNLLLVSLDPILRLLTNVLGPCHPYFRSRNLTLFHMGLRGHSSLSITSNLPRETFPGSLTPSKDAENKNPSHSEGHSQHTQRPTHIHLHIYKYSLAL